jgi:predicted  nucleic acid-binding Zn-ribbon protein
MNRASADVITLARQLGDAQSNHRALMDQLGRLYEDMRAQYGSSIDRARPYLEVQESLNTAWQRVQSAVRDFSAASSQHSQAKAELRSVEERLAYGAHNVALDSRQQDGLSRATVRVLRCQNERDSLERDYTVAFKEYQELHPVAEARRAQVGDSTIRKAQPGFKMLQQHQQKLAAEQSRIESLSDKSRVAKSTHRDSMAELERISNAVHTLRQEYAAARNETGKDAPPVESFTATQEATVVKIAPKAEEPDAAPETEVPKAVGTTAEDIYDAPKARHSGGYCAQEACTGWKQPPFVVATEQE